MLAAELFATQQKGKNNPNRYQPALLALKCYALKGRFEEKDINFLAVLISASEKPLTARQIALLLRNNKRKHKSASKPSLRGK